MSNLKKTLKIIKLVLRYAQLVLGSAVQCNAVQCSAVQCSAEQYFMLEGRKGGSFIFKFFR
jgi:hypothetical protein